MLLDCSQPGRFLHPHHQKRRSYIYLKNKSGEVSVLLCYTCANCTFTCVKMLLYTGLHTSFKVATEVYKKALKGFNGHFSTAVYWSHIEPVLTFNIASWYNFLTEKSKKKLTRIIKPAQIQLSDLYSHAAISGTGIFE